MPGENAPRVVGILNTTEDVVEVLGEVLRDAGYDSVAAFLPDFKRGRGDVAAWLADLDPTVILYDVAAPYAENWAYYRTVRALPTARPHEFVLTTTNVRALAELAGEVGAIEFVGKPFDLDEIARAVEAGFARLGRRRGGTSATP